ncbi:50S ribosomal protein L28 [Hibiscus syriacus]|uniref:50S ribosomal protein L28 n=1 Tax=Hibiscus syriacus TaxID=106335 RepID=A0A6A3D9Z8_HIBSY|nr:50S ribosomal protein L28 [Hibiscus syriacus]
MDPTLLTALFGYGIRHLASSSTCRLCNGEDESMLHVLRKCPDGAVGGLRNMTAAGELCVMLMVIGKIKVETNCAEAMRVINRHGGRDGNTIGVLIHEILNRNWEAKIRQIERNANNVADKLAGNNCLSYFTEGASWFTNVAAPVKPVSSPFSPALQPVARRICPFTGKKANKANHKTKRLQFVNLQYKKVWWEAGKRYVKLRLSTIEKNGLDAVANNARVDLRKE